MIQTLVKNWPLLALCGVLDAMISVIYFIMLGTDGPLTFHSWSGTIVLQGKLALGAGACAIAAGIWGSSAGKSWPLVLNGFAMGALGLIQYDLAARFRISFLTVALLVILMAVSIGSLELSLARSLRRHSADRWFLTLAGVVSVGFALTFFALGLRWVKMEPGSHADLFWLGSFFGFSAFCLLGIALRMHSRGFSQSGTSGALPLLGNPRHP